MLTNDKHEVVVIEKEHEEAERMSEDLDVVVLEGEGTNRKILLDAYKELDKSADCFIAATGDDKVNILACEITKRYGVQRTLSRVTDPENYEIFLDLDIVPINESLIVTEALRRAVHMGNKHNIIASIAEGGAEIVRYIVKETSQVVDKRVKELGLERHMICIDRAGEVILPDEKTAISVGDTLYYVVKVGESERVKNTLKDGE